MVKFNACCAFGLRSVMIGRAETALHDHHLVDKQYWNVSTEFTPAFCYQIYTACMALHYTLCGPVDSQ